MGNRKSSHKFPSYNVSLPSFSKAWDVVYSGNIHQWSLIAGRYGLDNYSYGCFGKECDRVAICRTLIKAVYYKHKRILDFERFKQNNIQITLDENTDFVQLVKDGYILDSVIASMKDHYVILILSRQTIGKTNFSFPLVDLSTKCIVGVMTPPHKRTIVHCSFSPDSLHTAMLCRSDMLCRTDMLESVICYELFLYCNKSMEVMKCVTLNSNVQPYFAFDPRYRWSRISVANYEFKDAGILNAFVVFSLEDCRTIKRSKLPLNSFDGILYNLLYSKDGELVILQKYIKDDSLGKTSYLDTYIFDSDSLQLLKYLTTTITGFVNVCVNKEPVFSHCASYMRILKHCSVGDTSGLKVDIY